MAFDYISYIFGLNITNLGDKERRYLTSECSYWRLNWLSLASFQITDAIP